MTQEIAIIEKPLTQDIIKLIASDIGKELVAYIEVMYPAAIESTSSTFKTSVRNNIYNQIMAAVKINDEGEILARLQDRAAFRKKWVKQYRNIRRKHTEGA